MIASRPTQGTGLMRYQHFLVSRDLGGAGLIALKLAAWSARQGMRVGVWIPGGGPAAEAAEQEGLSWRGYDLAAMTAGSWRHAWACGRLALKLPRRPGLAHVHMPGAYRLIRPALRLAGLRTVVHVQIDPSPEDVTWAFRDPPDVVVTCARYMIAPIRQALGERGAGLRIEAVPNAVDLDHFFPGDRPAAKRQLGAPVDRPLVLMLANLAPHKGQETAIRAVAELKARGTAVECWLAGIERGPGQDYEGFLRSLTAELGVADRVRFLGFRSDGPELLRAADFLLLPSTREGLPFAVLEAQASKTAVLAAPTAGVPEAVADGETGFLIPAADAAGYARRIETVLDNPELYHGVTERALAAVRRDYSWAAFCGRIQELYREVLEGAGTDPRGGKEYRGEARPPSFAGTG
jgi:glycosyltransferase involved in cell wall biosynthesis